MKQENDRINHGPIGVFDSGYGGLTILRRIRRRLPDYSYLYLGDNARAPYGSRSFELVHHFTRQAVEYLFAQGCRLVILACNTASAKALRTIQQEYLPRYAPERRVLGVIRPTVESLPATTRNRHIGLMATPGTVASHSYRIETAKIDPEMHLTEMACPLLVPLIENGEAESEGADWFVAKYTRQLLEADPEIDTILLGCTHYPLITDAIRRHVPEKVKLLEQGPLVAESLADYLRRHPEIEERCLRGADCRYLTTEDPGKFDPMATAFTGTEVRSHRIDLENCASKVENTNIKHH